jgi:hypothetical protein
MSPPEVWGPPIWTLFHCLAEKIHPDAYSSVVNSMFGMIKQICKVLPCPECSQDATNFLGKLNISNYKTKDDFRLMLYLFHNYVNAKKHKPIFVFSNLPKYSKLNMNLVVNNFIAKYHTKGNMKLLTESFQRSFVVKNFIVWYRNCYRAFVYVPVINQLPEPPKVETKDGDDNECKDESL